MIQSSTILVVVSTKFLKYVLYRKRNEESKERDKVQLSKIRNTFANMPPLVLAIIAGFVIIVIATLFPEIKQTIIEIAQAIR